MPYTDHHALVDTAWLSDHLGDDTIRIIEVDEDTSLYEESHIPGAIAWSWSTDLHHETRRDYLDQDGFSSLLAAAGVGADTTVVLYSGNNNWFAAYAYWLLKYRGFDKVKLLDGGRQKWELDGLALTTERPTYTPSGFKIAGPERPELRVFRDEVLTAVESATFIDVRSPEEFSGKKLAPDHLPQEQPYVGGHIPGAKNVPWSRAANEDGTFKRVAELQAIYGDAGVTDTTETIAYCRIGERSSHTWFVLHELLGHRNAKNYDGSWTEYGSLVNVPVVVGS
ncbi:MAG: sulfurtransferase [Acidimicrobiia bacterium]|nr:sulfurtransferase [Acidimicrobiia bacterium]